MATAVLATHVGNVQHIGKGKEGCSAQNGTGNNKWELHWHGKYFFIRSNSKWLVIVAKNHQVQIPCKNANPYYSNIVFQSNNWTTGGNKNKSIVLKSHSKPILPQLGIGNVAINHKNKQKLCRYFVGPRTSLALLTLYCGLHQVWGRTEKEYLKDPSTIHQHSNHTGHPISHNNFQIIWREGHSLARNIKESIFIRVNNPTLKRNIGKFSLPLIWDRFLLKTPSLNLKRHAHAVGHVNSNNSNTPL